MVLRPQGLIPERRRRIELTAEIARRGRGPGGDGRAVSAADAPRAQRRRHRWRRRCASSSVTKEFGGLVAVNDVSLDVPAAVDRLAHRAQRRRQDDAVQHAHRALQADRRADPARRPRHQPPAPGPDHRPRRRPHVSEHPPVRRDERAGERDDRPPRADARRAGGLDRAHAAASAARSGRPRSARASCSPTSGCAPGSSTSSPPSSPTAISGASRSPGRWPPSPTLLLLDEPTAGMNPQESAPADRLHAQAARRAEADDPADRARHEGRDGRLRARQRCSTTARRSPRAPRPRCAQNPRVIEAYLGKQD